MLGRQVDKSQGLERVKPVVEQFLPLYFGRLSVQGWIDDLVDAELLQNVLKLLSLAVACSTTVGLSQSFAAVSQVVQSMTEQFKTTVVVAQVAFAAGIKS